MIETLHLSNTPLLTKWMMKEEFPGLKKIVAARGYWTHSNERMQEVQGEDVEVLLKNNFPYQTLLSDVNDD